MIELIYLVETIMERPDGEQQTINRSVFSAREKADAWVERQQESDWKYPAQCQMFELPVDERG